MFVVVRFIARSDGAYNAQRWFLYYEPIIVKPTINYTLEDWQG